MKEWTEAELGRDRRYAIDDFIRERLREPLDVYIERFDAAEDAIHRLLAATDDLTALLTDEPDDALRGNLMEVVCDSELQYAFRYLAGPPISEDDLLTVSDLPSLSRTRLEADPSLLDGVARTIAQAHDRRRFPWLESRLKPTESEKQAAIRATAALIAYQRYQTWRRTHSGKSQEDLVAEVLHEAGLEEVPPREIEFAQDAPGPGTFCRESRVRSEKADLVIGLWDRRIMPVECKVSNSSVNSYKRLNREAAGKAAFWRRELGTQVVPAAVLSGVYAHPSLEQAQERGLSLFWTHSLEGLTAFIEATRR